MAIEIHNLLIVLCNRKNLDLVIVADGKALNCFLGFGAAGIRGDIHAEHGALFVGFEPLHLNITQRGRRQYPARKL